MAKPVLFLIDGSSQMYRAYHAFRGKGLSNQEGQTTHAVLVFVSMLRNLIAQHRPDHIAASFDLSGPTFRDEIVTDYKATREAMPDDLAEQIGWVHEACEALGVPVLTAEGYEADDIIGTLALRADAAGFEVAVVSPDKDFAQLVRPGIRIYDPRDDGTWMDEVGVVAKFGVQPSQIIDMLALMGDNSDNVKGVPGIGKKGAVDLLVAHGSLDALLEKAAELPQKKYREALVNHRADALQSRQLVTIHTDVPLAQDLESLRYQGPNRERCYELFSRLGFRTLTGEFAPTADSILKDYALVRTMADLEACVTAARTAGEIGLHVVADGDSAVRGRILGIALSWADRQARLIPVREPQADSSSPMGSMFDAPEEPDTLRLADALGALRGLLEDAGVRKVGHDSKADLELLARHGVTLRGLACDTMLASYLIDANRPNPALENVAIEHLGYKASSLEEVVGRGAKATPLAQASPEALLTYAGERADLPRQLAHVLEPLLVQESLDGVFDDMEMPLVPVLAAIERAGIRVDVDALAAQSRHIEQELASLTTRLYALAGGEFNVNSPKQLGEILFDKLQLPALKKTGKTRTASTAVEVLEELALTHEFPRLVLDWRSLHKLKSTYLDALPAIVNPDTGRVHTSFNQAVAATGRLSSTNPNLQNIPIRTELGRQIRSAFIAEPGHVLISADYSQIELRVLAHLSGDETLIAAFKSGADIHDQTALKVFGPNSGLDPYELRRRAKIVNYALLYGKTAFTLAKDINVPVPEAQAFIDAYFAGFPRVRAYIDETLEDARRTGVVRTMFGRRRPAAELNSHNGQMRASAERMAVNMPIQGTAADILKRAMIGLHRAIPERGLLTRMILTVHDELVFEAPEAEAEVAVALVREQMEGAAALAVPLTVDVGAGPNWRDAKP